MNEYDYYFEEYKLLTSTTHQYFEYMYKTITLALTFFSAACTLFFTSTELFVSYFVLNFLLPVILYIFGLLYAYNLCVVGRTGCLSIDMEIVLKRKYKNFQGWVRYSKMYNGGFIAYGTALAFFILFPAVSLLLAPDYNVDITKTRLCYLFNKHLFGIPILALILYFVYIILILLIIRLIYKYFRATKKKMKQGDLVKCLKMDKV